MTQTLTKDDIANMDWKKQRNLYESPLHINEAKREMTIQVNVQFLSDGKTLSIQRMVIIPLLPERMSFGWEYGEPVKGRNVMCDKGILDADEALYALGIQDSRPPYQCEWDRVSKKPMNQLVWRSFEAWAFEQLENGTILREKPSRKKYDEDEDEDRYCGDWRRREWYD